MFSNRDMDYMVDSDSGEDNGSSDDEIDIMLNGSMEQRKRLAKQQKPKSKEADSDSEDEFEKEMNAELNSTLRGLQEQHGKPVKGKNKRSTGNADDEQYYDNDYYDSDSDEEGTSHEKQTAKHPVMSNDDLLYDPTIDDENQRWVDKMRRRCQPQTNKNSTSGSTTAKPKPLPNSDAVLNCPACMTTLCLDCQRHVKYHNQYRAMFVMNCQVDMDEALMYPKDNGRKQSKKKTKKLKLNMDNKETNDSGDSTVAPTPQNDNDKEMVHPVHCKECTTEVGVFDSDEIYHFFNVLSSYG